MNFPTITLPPNVKAALTSVLIGFCISILTILFQALLGWLTELDPAIPGVLSGIGRYLYKWKMHQIV